MLYLPPVSSPIALGRTFAGVLQLHALFQVLWNRAIHDTIGWGDQVGRPCRGVSDVFSELIFDGIIDSWFGLIRWIVPEKLQNEKARSVIKLVIDIFAALLMICVFIGLFAVISDDDYTRRIGKYMIFIPLGISAVQILIGIIVKIADRNR